MGRIWKRVRRAAVILPLAAALTLPTLASAEGMVGSTDMAWEHEFQMVHGRLPTDQDRADRAWSLDFAAKMGHAPTEADWIAHFEAEHSMMASNDAMSMGNGQMTMGDDMAWEKTFEMIHGRMPTDQDRADRAWSLDFLARTGHAPTEADWIAHALEMMAMQPSMMAH